AEYDAFDEPQRVGRTKHQGRTREECVPDVRLERCEDDEEFTDESGGTGQAGVREREQHHEHRKLGHGVHVSTIRTDFTAVHAVVHDAHTEEHCGGHQAV